MGLPFWASFSVFCFGWRAHPFGLLARSLCKSELTQSRCYWWSARAWCCCCCFSRVQVRDWYCSRILNASADAAWNLNLGFLSLEFLQSHLHVKTFTYFLSYFLGRMWLSLLLRRHWTIADLPSDHCQVVSLTITVQSSSVQGWWMWFKCAWRRRRRREEELLKNVVWWFE